VSSLFGNTAPFVGAFRKREIEAWSGVSTSKEKPQPKRQPVPNSLLSHGVGERAPLHIARSMPVRPHASVERDRGRLSHNLSLQRRAHVSSVIG
jgi:hypothetical protein